MCIFQFINHDKPPLSPPQENLKHSSQPTRLLDLPLLFWDKLPGLLTRHEAKALLTACKQTHAIFTALPWSIPTVLVARPYPSKVYEYNTSGLLSWVALQLLVNTQNNT